jgi:hypothetical protein
MTSGIRFALLSCRERRELKCLAWSLWSAGRPEARGWTRVNMLGTPGSGKTTLPCAARSLVPSPATMREAWLSASRFPPIPWRALSSSLLSDVNPRSQLPACRPQALIGAKPQACGIEATMLPRPQPGHCSLFFTDISTNRRSDHQQRHLQAALRQIIQNACDHAGLAWDDCRRKEGSDAILVIATADLSVPLDASMSRIRSHSTVGASAQLRPDEAIHVGLAAGRSAPVERVAGVETHASAYQSTAASAIRRIDVRATRRRQADLHKYPTGRHRRRMCHRQPTTGMVNRVDAMSRRYMHSGHLHPTGDHGTHRSLRLAPPKAELPH